MPTGKSYPAGSSPRTTDCGGKACTVPGGTIKPSSTNPSRRRGGPSNGGSRAVKQPHAQSSHSPKGGRAGKTSMKIARQKGGGY